MSVSFSLQERPIKEDTGCFVYEVVDEPVRVQKRFDQSSPTGVEFNKSELVAVDAILTYPNGSSLLRLGREGWLVDYSEGRQRLSPVAIQRTVKAVWVDNYPIGQTLKRHPSDRQDMIAEDAQHRPIHVYPLQKVYTDMCIVRARCRWYRVQGTNGWLVDRRPRPANQEAAEDDVVLLLEDDQVQLGLCAYLTRQAVEIRAEPDVGERSRTGCIIGPREIVVGELIRHSPFSYNNGPFVYLRVGADGTGGWLFERKQGERILSSMEMEFGTWFLKVVGEAGVDRRRQPVRQFGHATVDSTGSVDILEHYMPGLVLECDARMESPFGVWYYHVKGEDGWINDHRGGETFLESVDEGDSLSISMATPRIANTIAAVTKESWTPDFVRGMAASIEGLEEKLFDSDRHLLSFASPLGEIRVNYLLRSVEVEDKSNFDDNKSHGSGLTSALSRVYQCSPKDLAEILKDPSSAPRKSSSPPTSEVKPPSTAPSTPTLSERSSDSPTSPPQVVHTSDAIDTDQSLQLHTELMECERALELYKERQRQLLASIQQVDQKDVEYVAKLLGRRPDEVALPSCAGSFASICLSDDHEYEEITIDGETVGESTIGEVVEEESPAKHESSEGEQLVKQCTECGVEFPSARLRHIHCLSAHGRYSCNYCPKTFPNRHALHSHRDALDHW